MLTQTTSRNTGKKLTSLKQSHHNQFAGLESLEQRAMMSASPVGTDYSNAASLAQATGHRSMQVEMSCRSGAATRSQTRPTSMSSASSVSSDRRPQTSVSGRRPANYTTTTTVTVATAIRPDPLPVVPAPQTEYWAVVIGASDYPGTNNDLPDCAADAKNMVDLLSNDLGVPSKNIHAMTGGARINSSSIASQFAWLHKQADADDVIVFYYSGHGGGGQSKKANDDETLCLPSDEQIPESKLGRMLSQLPRTTAKYVILDSCYGGGFTGLSRTVPNTMVAAACKYNELATSYFSGGTPNGMYGGIFTSWLIDAFRTNAADTDGNSHVNLKEAFDYSQLNASISGGQQPVISGQASVELERHYLKQPGWDFTRPPAHPRRPPVHHTTR